MQNQSQNQNQSRTATRTRARTRTATRTATGEQCAHTDGAGEGYYQHLQVTWHINFHQIKELDPQITQLSSKPWADHEPFDWKNNTTSIGRSVHMHCMMYSECIHAIHRIHRFHWFYGCHGLHVMEIDSMESLEFILASDQMCLVKWLLNTSITGNLPRKQSKYSHMWEIFKKSNLYTTGSGNSWIGWIDRLGTLFNV